MAINHQPRSVQELPRDSPLNERIAANLQGRSSFHSKDIPRTLYTRGKNTRHPIERKRWRGWLNWRVKRQSSRRKKLKGRRRLKHRTNVPEGLRESSFSPVREQVHVYTHTRRGDTKRRIQGEGGKKNERKEERIARDVAQWRRELRQTIARRPGPWRNESRAKAGQSRPAVWKLIDLQSFARFSPCVFDIRRSRNLNYRRGDDEVEWNPCKVGRELCSDRWVELGWYFFIDERVVDSKQKNITKQ